jgi:hypothetical protein
VSNATRLWGVPSESPYVKDAFHERAVRGCADAVNPERRGTKAAAWYRLSIPARGSAQVRLRLRRRAGDQSPGADGTPAETWDGFDRVFEQRAREADAFYAAPPRDHARLDPEERRVARQAAAGLLWSKQYYSLDIPAWLDGDPAPPRPPERRKAGRNAEWRHLNNADIISMPDKWEYPWYAA